jgi:hypothetical protein
MVNDDINKLQTLIQVGVRKILETKYIAEINSNSTAEEKKLFLSQKLKISLRKNT